MNCGTGLRKIESRPRIYWLKGGIATEGSARLSAYREIPFARAVQHENNSRKQEIKEWASPKIDLIGQGEKLSEEISRLPRGMGDKTHPYSFSEARRRLASQWKSTANAIEALPDLACPGGEAALELTLHPSYLAKSYYPGEFIRELGLHHLGSRAVHIVPGKVVAARAEESGKAQPAPVLYWLAMPIVW